MAETRRWLAGLGVLAGLTLAACSGGGEDAEDRRSADDEDEDDGTSPSTGGRSDAGGRDARAGSERDAGMAGRNDGGRADAGAPQGRDAGSAPARDAGQTTPPSGSDDLSRCAAPPEGASQEAVQAWTLVNELRLAAGAGCMNMVSALNTSAQAHCDYRVANRGDRACTADAHGELMRCAGFTGATAQAREIAAGYPRQLAYTEVLLTYGNDPTAAIPGWIDTVWHRIPLLDPWTTDMGWGGAQDCDVIDIGRGMSPAPADLVVVYPYDGQIDVPPAFSGIEGPAPPPPPSGWPSAYPINIYAQRISVSEHVLTKDGEDTPIEHLWLDAEAPEVGGLRTYFTNTAFLYGAPFELNTKYRVKIVGTYAGGDLNVEWSFTTGSRRPFGT